MKKVLLLCLLSAFAVPANAGIFTSIDERAEQIAAQLQGNESYEAHLARELASVALEEQSQHDTAAALEFIRMAEDHAARAGGSK